MRHHEDLRQAAQKALGQPVKGFSTEGVVQAKLELEDRTLTATAPAGTPAEEMLESLVQMAKEAE